MKKKLLKLFVFSALIVTGLAGCGQPKQPEHTHDYVSVDAVAPNCTEDGMAAYFTCKGCDKIFDADKKETTLEALKIGKLGHLLGLEVSGSYKTSYIIGETFDKNGMNVKKVCSREKCNYGENVTDFSVVYQNDGATSFRRGDTKVTVVAGELTKDVTVTVDVKPNVITGLNASYNVHCKEGISLEGVSATSGEVSIKYYSDAECTDEVTAAEMFGNATYYGVVKSDGVDLDYAIAEAKTEIVVAHECEEKDSLTTIGYKENVCKHCDAVVEKTTNKMTAVEKMFAVDGEGHFTYAYFGSNAMGQVKATDEGNRELVGGVKWYDEDETVDIIDATLPAVNFSLYTNVLMSWGSSAKPEWGVNSKISFGVNDEEDLLAKGDNSAYCYGILKFELESATSLKITNKTCDGIVKTLTIENENVISGEESLSLSLSIGNYRSFYLNSIILDHTTHTPGSELSNPTDRIGYKDLRCSICGEVCGVSTTKMATSDISLTNKYGADMTSEGGVQAASAYDGRINYIFGNETQTEYGLVLPVINYSLYENVEIDLQVASGWYYFGFDSSKQEQMKDHENLDFLVMKQTNGEYKATLTCRHDGADQDKVPTKYEVILAADVVNGTKGLSMFAKTNIPERSLYLKAIRLNDSHKHQINYECATDVIGTKTGVCSLCGYESTAVATGLDVDFNKSTYGASIYQGDTAKTISVVNGQINYSTDGDYKQNKMTLPKVDFAKYKQVTFEIDSHCYYGVDFAACWKDGGTKDATCGTTTITIDIVVNGENDLSAKLMVGANVINSKQETSADVYSGAAGFVVWGGNADPTTLFKVSVPTLIVNMGEHEHAWTTALGAVIGECHEVCTVCGQAKADSTKTAETADVSYARGYFGAHFNSIGWDSAKTEQSVSVVDNKVVYSSQNDYVKQQAYMPRVDYSKYSQVEFTLETNAHYGVGFTTGQCWKENESADATCGQKTITLKITVDGENNLGLSLIVEGQSVVTGTCTEASTYTGAEGLLVWFGIATTGAVMKVSTPVLTLK